MVKTKSKGRIKHLTKGHATEQTNYGRLHHLGPLIIKERGIRVGANQEIKVGSQNNIYTVNINV